MESHLFNPAHLLLFLFCPVFTIHVLFIPFSPLSIQSSLCPSRPRLLLPHKGSCFFFLFHTKIREQMTLRISKKRRFFPTELWRMSHVVVFIFVHGSLRILLNIVGNVFNLVGIRPIIKLILIKLIKETENSHTPHLGWSLIYRVIFTIRGPSF